MRIAVIGTGYVGLVAGVCCADSGHTVVCVDVDEEKILRLRQGESPIYEPGLEELLHKNLAAERLAFATDLPAAVKASEVVFLAVGTPPGAHGNADLPPAMNVANQIPDAAHPPPLLAHNTPLPLRP